MNIMNYIGGILQIMDTYTIIDYSKLLLSGALTRIITWTTATGEIITWTTATGEIITWTTATGESHYQLLCPSNSSAQARPVISLVC